MLDDEDAQESNTRRRAVKQENDNRMDIHVLHELGFIGRLARTNTTSVRPGSAVGCLSGGAGRES